MIKKIIILPGLLLLIVLSACNKQLEQIPADRVNDLSFWKNEDDADKFNLGVYAQLRVKLSQNYTHYIAGDLRAGMFTTTEKLANNQAVNQVLKTNTLKVFQQQGSKYASIFDWTAFYQAIESCNIALLKIDEIPDNKFKRLNKTFYKAESRFQRAFIYFYLVRLYGDVPLLVKARSSEPLGRATKDAVLDFVEKELTEIESQLPDRPVNNNWIALRPVKGTVNALLAHVYAWRHKYTECEQAASKVINSGVYTLSTGDKFAYRNIFKGKSAEGIFEIDFNNIGGSNEVSAVGGTIGPLTGGFIGNNFFTPVWSFPSRDTVKKIYTASDKRMAAFVDSTKNPLDLAGSTDTVRYAFAKYAFATNINEYYYYDANMIIFRLAGIILLRAEARAKLGNFAGAREDLNTIRQRAGLADYAGTDNDLLMAVLMERYRELYGEGQFYYDIVRLKELGMLKKLVPDADTYFAEDAWTWPVADAAFTDNPYMKQTMYWLR